MTKSGPHASGTQPSFRAQPQNRTTFTTSNSPPQLNNNHTKMFPQRTLLRTSQRFLRAPALRRTTQRRAASTESSFTGAEDNAFNRERKAVKDHAAATSGISFPLSSLSIYIFSVQQELTRHRSLAQAFHLVRNPHGQ